MARAMVRKYMKVYDYIITEDIVYTLLQAVIANKIMHVCV